MLCISPGLEDLLEFEADFKEFHFEGGDDGALVFFEEFAATCLHIWSHQADPFQMVFAYFDVVLDVGQHLRLLFGVPRQSVLADA